MKNINWIDKVVELLVVIIGITIAFSLNNWNEGRANRKLERKYLESMIYDLDSDINELEMMIDTLGSMSELNDRLINSLLQNNVNEDSAVLYVYTLIAISEFQKQDNTYESLRNSGNLGLLENFELEKEITNLYNNYYKQVAFIDDIHRSSVSEQFNPYVMQNMRFAGAGSFEDLDFMNSNYFMNQAFGVQYLVKGKIDIYKQSLVQAKKVKELVEKELE